MTDNEITQALECCQMNGLCEFCYLKSDKKECQDRLHKDVLDLINRQKAEIERLKPFERKLLNPVVKNLELEEALRKAQAEIEGLKRISPIVFGKEHKYCSLLGNVLCFSKSLDDYNDMRNGLKAEAIKEFWDKVKEQNTMDKRIVSVQSGDRILKEMVGEA